MTQLWCSTRKARQDGTFKSAQYKRNSKSCQSTPTCLTGNGRRSVMPKPPSPARPIPDKATAGGAKPSWRQTNRDNPSGAKLGEAKPGRAKPGQGEATRGQVRRGQARRGQAGRGQARRGQTGGPRPEWSSNMASGAGKIRRPLTKLSY